MIFSVSNQSGVDVYVCINQDTYYVKNGEKDVRIESRGEKQFVTVKRAGTIPMPPYKAVLVSEMLGLLALLFVKPWNYIVNVSSSYFFLEGKNTLLPLKVERITNQKNAAVIYDAVVATSALCGTTNVLYNAENEAEIVGIYKKSHRTAHFWLYFTLVLLFSFIFFGETYILSLLLGAFLGGAVGKALLYFLSGLFLLMILLLLIIPLHFWFKHEEKKFCKLMEKEEISAHLRG